MILFVNGYILGCEPFRPYWSSSRKDPDEYIKAAKHYFGDDHVVQESFINGSGDWFGSKAWSRQSYGRKLGLEMIPSLRKILTIGETIKIVSHSMGAASAEGIIETLVEHGFRIEKIVHFAPANAKGIKIPEITKHLDRVQLNASGDLVIERFADPFSKEDDLRIPGIKCYGKVKWDPWKYHPGHMSYLKDRKLPFDLDAHFDLKTYGFVFDWLRDLESLKLAEPIGKRTGKTGQRNIYEILIGVNNTQFERLFIHGRYLKFLEHYKIGVSDKFTGPLIT